MIFRRLRIDYFASRLRQSRLICPSAGGWPPVGRGLSRIGIMAPSSRPGPADLTARPIPYSGAALATGERAPGHPRRPVGGPEAGDATPRDAKRSGKPLAPPAATAFHLDELESVVEPRDLRHRSRRARASDQETPARYGSSGRPVLHVPHVSADLDHVVQIRTPRHFQHAPHPLEHLAAPAP